MASPADLTARSALSRLCTRCSVSLSRQSRAANGFAQTPKHQQRPLSTTSSRTRRLAPLSPLVVTNAASKHLAAGASRLSISTTSRALHEHDPFKFDPYYGNPYATPILSQDNLFHPFSSSPIRAIRERAWFIKRHSSCPHPDHAPGGSQLPKHSEFECPDCGVPLYCSKEHWADDYERHLEVCDILRQINEDDHDLHSGRYFAEFEYAGVQLDEALVNFSSWDTFLYTREFKAINSERSMRQATRILTYPITIGSILHELSPYNIKAGGRLTVEGLKSFSALRYNLHPPKNGGGPSIKDLRVRPPPVRIFVLGARAESSLPRDAWIQIAHLFPLCDIHLIFIGPEAMLNRKEKIPPRTPENPFGMVVEDQLWPGFKISTIADYYHTIHKTGYFYPYDPYFDCFVLFHPGLGHPASSHHWAETLPYLLETKAPIIVTGYTEEDMQRDINWVNEQASGEFDLLLEPGENTFRSLRWDLNDMDPLDISAGNWGVWAFRGKRYEATRKDA